MVAKSNPFEYGALLNRARGALPEGLASDVRWALPPLEILHEGRTTIVRNWKPILDTLRRDESHVMTYLLREIGTSGDSDGDRLIFTGKASERNIQDKLAQYVDIYVMCDECHRPDTHLTKDGRTTLLKCDACGAHKPVKAKKRKDGDGEGPLVEGKVMEIAVIGKNEKGVPFGLYHDVKVFVPGGEVGKPYKVQIMSVLGPTAIAKIAT